MAMERKPLAHGASGGPPGMLVAVADEAVRRMMGELLTLEGYSSVLLADDGQEAVRLVRASQQPLLVLLGSLLPTLSGQQVVAEIEAEPLLARYHTLLLLGTDWEWRQPKRLPHPPWPMLGLPFQLPALLGAVERGLCQLEARRSRPRPRGKLFE